MSSTPTRNEIKKARNWFENAFKPAETGEISLPMSFLLAGKESNLILSKWAYNREKNVSGSCYDEYIITFTDPGSGLECRFEIKLFNDFSAVEWTGHFKNTSDKPSPIISDIQALAATFKNKGECDPRVHYAKGSDCRIDDFEPLEYVLGESGRLEMWSKMGRSSDGAGGGSLPFFNLQLGDNGVIGAIGWSGSWLASFSREACEISARAGMLKTNISLLPGEEIRTPKMLLMFWEGGDWIRSQNMFRQLILAHYTPRKIPSGIFSLRGEHDSVLTAGQNCESVHATIPAVNGVPAKAPICGSAWGAVRCEDQLRKVGWWKEHGIPIDMYWIDAGWHGDADFKEDTDTFGGEWWAQPGNWWPNETTYPNGLKPIGDMLKNAGIGFVLWFEPERVYKGTRLTVEHPEWLLGPDGDNYLFNLGIPEARKYLTDLISSIISEGGVTCYRQDFNMPVTAFWNAADAPDRVGMSEIRHIEGLYAFWDELRTRHPGLLIDNCSSGGRRIDLETTSRAIPLWRSDFQCALPFNPIGMQGQTHGLSLWVPLSAGCSDNPGTYACRSAFGPGLVFSGNTYGSNPPDDSQAEPYRKMALEQKKIAGYFQGDFYPLLPYSISDGVWALWQVDRPDLERGVILAYRRQESPYCSLVVQLRELDPEAAYEIRSWDGGETIKLTGKDLMENGLQITIDDKPGAVVFEYEKMG